MTKNNMKTNSVIVTGGAGFIGSAVIRHIIEHTEYEVINFDKMTYAASPRTNSDLVDNERYQFIKGDICDAALFSKTLKENRPKYIMHLAAESHVDRSIDEPFAFIETNVLGTCKLLDESLKYWKKLSPECQNQFRFLHVSTDEVYGSLGDTGAFTEETAYSPNSPYSASKASSDHFVRAWHKTHKLPVIISNCSNNYGPYQFPEKLIPLMIIKALAEEPLPVYGAGLNVRDWLYVTDHASALWTVIQNGKCGECYNIGGKAEYKNIDVVKLICGHLDNLHPRQNGKKYEDLITHVIDRPGHDLRYAIDISKIERDLNWSPSINFSDGIKATIDWYLNNTVWWEEIKNNTYAGERLGGQNQLI